MKNYNHRRLVFACLPEPYKVPLFVVRKHFDVSTRDAFALTIWHAVVGQTQAHPYTLTHPVGEASTGWLYVLREASDLLASSDKACAAAQAKCPRSNMGATYSESLRRDFINISRHAGLRRRSLTGQLINPLLRYVMREPVCMGDILLCALWAERARVYAHEDSTPRPYPMLVNLMYQRMERSRGTLAQILADLQDELITPEISLALWEMLSENPKSVDPTAYGVLRPISLRQTLTRADYSIPNPEGQSGSRLRDVMGPTRDLDPDPEPDRSAQG